MIQIKLKNKNPTEVVEIVHEMKKEGLVIGKDFDFSYQPPYYNNDGWSPIIQKQTVFTFYNEKIATWFTLKWT